MSVEELREIVLKHHPNIRIGIVHARQNKRIVDILVKGAKDRLLSLGVKPKNIFTDSVASPCELPYGTQIIDRVVYPKRLDAVISIGVTIKGSDMPESLYNSITHQLMELIFRLHKPVIFGMLTLTEGQCGEKAGFIEGSMYKKGEDWGSAAVEMGDKFELHKRRRYEW